MNKNQEYSTLQWSIGENLFNSAAVVNRNIFAENLALKSPQEIVANYVYLSKHEMEDLFKIATRRLKDNPIKGIGIELGAGCGLLSSVIAQSADVEKIYAVEICEKMSNLIIPKISSWVIGSGYRKVVPVIGSFDNLELESRSLDFAVEIDSYHHSSDLKTTFSECHRVLKPGGTLICIDRCHPDTLSDDDVEKMLSLVYSKEFLISNYYPSDTILTRKQNGEHEYRYSEWKEAFILAGFDEIYKIEILKYITFKSALKGLLSVIPGVNLTYKKNTIKNTFDYIAQFLPRLFGWGYLGPKATTIFALRKKE